jgi:hypothetical protein
MLCTHRESEETFHAKNFVSLPLLCCLKRQAHENRKPDASLCHFSCHNSRAAASRLHDPNLARIHTPTVREE